MYLDFQVLYGEGKKSAAKEVSTWLEPTENNQHKWIILQLAI